MGGLGCNQVCRESQGNPTACVGSWQQGSTPLLLSCGMVSSGDPLPLLVKATVPDSTSTVKAAHCDLPTFTCRQGCGSWINPVPAVPEQ